MAWMALLIVWSFLSVTTFDKQWSLLCDLDVSPYLYGYVLEDE